MRDPGRPSTASSAGIAASPPHRRASSRRRSAVSSEPEVDGPRGWGARRAAADRRREDGPLAPARRGPAQPLLTPQAPGAPLAYRVALATQQRVRGLPALPRMGTGDGPERRRTGPPPPRAPALRDPDHCPPATLRGQKSRPQTPVRARRALPRQARASRTAARSAASAERRRREPKRHGRRRVHRRDRARRSRGATIRRHSASATASFDATAMSRAREKCVSVTSKSLARKAATAPCETSAAIISRGARTRAARSTRR